jgi:ankyrin repeat protein
MNNEIKSADGETKKKYSLYDLEDAIDKEDVKLVLEILHESPSLAKSDDDDMYPEAPTTLHNACFAGNDKILEALLDCGADINQCWFGDPGSVYTPLELAQSISCEELLITRGISQIINEDVTLLHKAAYDGDFRRGTLLLSRGAQMDIFAAAGFGFLHEIRIRLKSSPGLAQVRLTGCLDELTIGTDTKPLWDYPFGRGETVLHWAARGCPTAITSLCRAGANLNAVSAYGETPLHWAIAGYETESIKELLELGANPDLGDVNGITPRSLFVTIADEAVENVPENREDWEEAARILDRISKGCRATEM